jgi:hypothetical protein
MEQQDEKIFLAAAILLAAAVGQSHEPVDEKQVGVAVENAHKLSEAVDKRRKEINDKPNS